MAVCIELVAMEATVALLLMAVVAPKAIVAAAVGEAAIVVAAADVALVFIAESRNSRSHNQRDSGVDNRVCVANCL